MDRYLALTESLFTLKRNQTHAENPNHLYIYDLLRKPASQYKTIHVAGTNGKGSVTLKIANSLKLAGYKTGLFISPHIHTFQERIQINGEMIKKEDVVFYLDSLQEIFHQHKIKYNFFEITTMMALLYFRDHDVDVAVIETGIGGRYDITNVVTPLLSIITNITKDHEKYLGDTLEAIAFQKAGIFKKGVPALIGYRAAFRSVLEEAFIKESPLTVMPPCSDSSYSVENTLIAKEALHILSSHFSLSEETISTGITKEQPCRFECLTFKGMPPVIFDVAHNVDGFAKLILRLKSTYPDRSYHFVFGVSKEKDYMECIKLLKEVANTVYLVTSPHEFGLEISLLEEAFYSINYHRVRSHPTISETVADLLENIEENRDVIVVSGTFYIMEPVKDFIQHQARLFLASSGELK